MTISEIERINGQRVALRLVQPSDAEYIFGLRTNPTYNQHLSAVSGTADDQRAWIERYKSREQALQELYYVIERLDTGQACGLVRLYDIADGNFTWGSWILDHSKPPKAALDSAVLIYVIGFDLLGLTKAVFDVRRENKRTIAFHERFGAAETSQDDINTYFELTKAEFDRRRGTFLDVLTAEKWEDKA